MEKIKEFFKSKTISYYLMVGVFVASLITLLMYSITGGNEYNKNKIDSLIIVADIIALVASCAALVFEIRYIKYVSYLALLFSFIYYICVEINFVANVFVATDPVSSTVLTNFIVTLITAFIGCVLSIVSYKIQRKREFKANDEGNKEE